MSTRQKEKLFMAGRSQAVRLPLDLRFEGDEVYIRKDPETGHVIISKRPGDWEDFFELIKENKVAEDFMSQRYDNEIPQDRDLF